MEPVSPNLADLKPQPETLRRQPRFALDGYAEVCLPTGGLRYTGRIVDISLSGCFVAAANCNFERGTYVEIFFEAGGLKFRLPANVAVMAPGRGVGVAFQPMSSRREADLRQLLAEISQSA